MASRLCAPCKNSFCLYVTVAVGINIGNVVVGAKAVPSVSRCKGSTWLVVNLAFALAHIAAAAYVARAVADRANRRLAAAGKTTALGRAAHMLCHDPWIAAYLVVLVAHFAWLWAGASWRATGEYRSGGGCPDDVGAWIGTGLGCGFAFFVCGFWALCASLCCAWCCDRTDYTPNPPAEQPGYVPQQQQVEDPPAPSAPDTDVEAGKGGKSGDDAGGTIPTTINESVVPVPPPATAAATVPTAPIVNTPSAKADPSDNPNAEIPIAVAVPCTSEKPSAS